MSHQTAHGEQAETHSGRPDGSQDSALICRVTTKYALREWLSAGGLASRDTQKCRKTLCSQPWSEESEQLAPGTGVGAAANATYRAFISRQIAFEVQHCGLLGGYCSSVSLFFPFLG